MQKIKSFKIKVTAEQSAEVQKIIFDNGGQWSGFGERIIKTEPFLKIKYLFFDGKKLSTSATTYVFDSSAKPIITYDRFIQLYSNKSLLEG